MTRTLATLAFVIMSAFVMVVLFAACTGGGGHSPTPTRATVQRLTGESVLDQALTAALMSDTITMAGLTGYQHVSCAATTDASHPACRPDEQTGAPVEVFLSVGCNAPGWVRPNDLPDLYGAALKEKQPRLVAVYAPSAAVQFARLGAEYVAIIGTQPGGADLSVALWVKGGRFVALEDDCGNPQRLLDDAWVASWLIRPDARDSRP